MQQWNPIAGYEKPYSLAVQTSSASPSFRRELGEATGFPGSRGKCPKDKGGRGSEATAGSAQGGLAAGLLPTPTSRMSSNSQIPAWILNDQS